MSEDILQKLFDFQPSEVSTFSCDDMIEAYDHFVNKWLSTRFENSQESYVWLFQNIGLDHEVINTPNVVNNAFRKEIAVIGNLYKVMVQMQEDDDPSQTMLSDDTNEGVQRSNQFNRIFEVLHFARQFLVYNQAMLSISDDDTHPTLTVHDHKRL